MEPKAVSRAKSLYSAGYAIDHICRTLHKEGYRATNKKDQRPTRISRHVLETVLGDEGSKLVEAPAVVSSFEAFYKSQVTRVPDTIDPKTGLVDTKKCRLLASELRKAYHSWMKKNRPKEKAMAWGIVGKHLKQWGIERRYSHSGRVAYAGLAIKKK